MSQQPHAISWVDLTVPDAGPIRDFYAAVTGWVATEVPMDGYSDYCMAPPGAAQPVAGICHARGPNTKLPPQWLVYIPVASLDESLRRCRELGGTIIEEPRSLGAFGRFAVIQDPAGAAAAIFEAPPKVVLSSPP